MEKYKNLRIMEDLTTDQRRAIKELSEKPRRSHFSIFTTNIDSTSGRGIVILVHSSISHLVIQVAPVIQFEEACLLEIKLKGSDVTLFGCIYRNPTQTSGLDENNNNLNVLVYRLSDNKRSHRLLQLSYQLESMVYSFSFLQRRRIIPRNIKKFLSVPACTHWINGPTRKTRSRI